MASDKNFFKQLGEGLQRLTGFGDTGYWDSILRLIKKPSGKNLGKAIGDVATGIGSGVTGTVGYMPEIREPRTVKAVDPSRSVYEQVLRRPKDY